MALSLNFRLAALLAWRSMRQHRTVAIATLLGVALGMVVVGAILIVDYHSTQAGITTPLVDSPAARGQVAPLDIVRVYFEHQGRPVKAEAFPTQKGQVSQELKADIQPSRRGEEDYQAMRLAVRVASLLAFAVGAVIVFYTMRFSVSSRSREFCLLLCLGERRANVALCLLLETLALGIAGTLLGLLASLPAAAVMIGLNISTTGRVPTKDFALPWAELLSMGGLSVAIALLAVVGPARAIFKMRIVEVLQPRFLRAEIDESILKIRGFGLLLPPLMAAAYIALRPFLFSWLTVVQFFLLESAFVLLLAVAILWGMTPLLRGLVWLLETVLKPGLPLEALLAGRRMRLTSHKLVFTLVGVTLVFSLLTALHDITRALKDEIHRWSEEALSSYVFYRRNEPIPLNQTAFRQALERHGLYFFRLSDKLPGEFPVRLVAGADINPYLQQLGIPPLRPGTVLLSRTLAARFSLKAGDAVLIDTPDSRYRFQVIAVTDAVGYYAENGQYVDLKSYLLFSDGNPLFADNLEHSLGRYGALRSRSGVFPSRAALAEVRPFYTKTNEGWAMKYWQKREIDRDFAIFDFILSMTVILAAVGVANTILIQVHARGREFSVLRSLGVSRQQVMRILLVEGCLIGMVAALLSLALGNAMGAVSVSFLDRFTLFNYRFVFSYTGSVLISALAVLVCCLAALYPAWLAYKVSSAESLHYE